MTDTYRVQEHLKALPEVELPESLWERMQAGRKQRARQRRLVMGVATLALVMVTATAILAPLQESNQARSAPIAADEMQAELRAIDQALQAAYDRGASDAEIAPMWVARDALLASAPAKTKTNQT